VTIDVQTAGLALPVATPATWASSRWSTQLDSQDPQIT